MDMTNKVSLKLSLNLVAGNSVYSNAGLGQLWMGIFKVIILVWIRLKLFEAVISNYSYKIELYFINKELNK